MEVDFAVPAWLLWTAVSVAAAFAYAVVGGVTAGVITKIMYGRMPEQFVRADEVPVILGGAFWPVALPVAVGYHVAVKVANLGVPSKKEK